MRLTITFIAGLLAASGALAENFDKSEELNGVSLKSGKQEAVRSYAGSIEKSLPYPMPLVRKAITNFTEKCNNDYKSKRKYTDEKTDCKYHNDHIVESFIVKDIRGAEYFQGASEFYLIGRQIYNRGSFGYYELLQVREGQNEKNQKTTTVMLRMLSDEEVKNFTSPKFKRESAFDSSHSTFVLTEVSPNETHLSYSYSADTDHWILNKEISVPQVFASISKSINDLLATVEQESSLQKRELASKE